MQTKRGRSIEQTSNYYCSQTFCKGAYLFITASNLASVYAQSIGDIIKKVEVVLLDLKGDIEQDIINSTDSRIIDRFIARHLAADSKTRCQERHSESRNFRNLFFKEACMDIAGITEATQYLSCTLEDEVFALDITKVREVLDFTTVTRRRVRRSSCGA